MPYDLTKHSYKTLYSNQQDIEKFYSLVLNNAKSYKRVSAYFSVGIFSLLKKGIPEFLQNDGYMQLIISIDTSPEMLKVINDSYRQKSETTLSISHDEIMKRIKEVVTQKDVDIFSFLIAIGKLDIRLAYKPQGIVHDKFGLISDGMNNLAYIGSNNFTENAAYHNDEAFQVTIDWDNPSKRERTLINDLNTLFEQMWNNEKEDVITIELPDPVIQNMIDSMDYSEICKFTNETKYIRFDIDNNEDIVITYNIDIKNVLKYKYIGEYSSSSFLSFDKKCIRFINLMNVNEKKAIVDRLKNAAQKENIPVYFTQKLQRYFQIHYRDYESLRSLGEYIKSKAYLNTNKFYYYKKTINNCIQRPLKDHQIQAAVHIIELNRSLNFSVPGSGKTATVLGAFEYLASQERICDERIKHLMVVGPINCAKAWRDEYEVVSKYSKKHKPLCLINDDLTWEKIEILKHDFETSRLIIVNYELLPKISEELGFLIDEKTMVVFDEIHRIKKIDSPKYQALYRVIKNTRYRVALTGTPLPNGYIDLFNMISLLHDDYVSTYFQMYESDLKADDARYRKTGLQNSDLNNALFPFYIRVNKKDLDIPAPEPDHLVEILLNKYESELYKKVLDSNFNSFEKTIKLIEIGCVPFKCSQDISDYSTISQQSDGIALTSKLCKFISIVKRNNKKCVVWCNFVDTIKKVSELLNSKNIYAKPVYGETKQEERDKIVNEFNYGTLQAIVTNPATLAESVSLHRSCHEAHYLELNYNLYQYLQSRDRIHRLGLAPTDKTEYYIYLNFYDQDKRLSMDYDIYKALQKKEELQEKSLKNGNFVFDDNIEYM